MSRARAATRPSTCATPFALESAPHRRSRDAMARQGARCAPIVRDLTAGPAGGVPGSVIRRVGNRCGTGGSIVTRAIPRNDATGRQAAWPNIATGGRAGEAGVQFAAAEGLGSALGALELGPAEPRCNTGQRSKRERPGSPGRTCDGGAGIRTPVRASIQPCLYVRRPRLMSSPPGAQPPKRQTSLLAVSRAVKKRHVTPA